MVDSPRNLKKGRLPRIVGNFIREKREKLGISQRALGQLFSPPVTTQFISNVERGITPLPPSHVPTLAQALRVSEQEFRQVLEKEYALRLSGRLGEESGIGTGAERMIQVDPINKDFLSALNKALSQASPQTRADLIQYCKEKLGISLNDSDDSTGSQTPV